jgi:hypothetical protein
MNESRCDERLKARVEDNIFAPDITVLPLQHRFASLSLTALRAASCKTGGNNKQYKRSRIAKKGKIAEQCFALTRSSQVC